MENSDLIKLIVEQVNLKVLELSRWKQVRWEGGRLYFETTKLTNEINEYNLETQIFYLESLLNRTFVIQDNWPHEAPDITQEFKDWLAKRIAGLKIFQIQEKSKAPKLTTSKKKRKRIPYKTRSLLQKEIDSACPFCENEDVDHFQVHHIDENPDNSKFTNLIMLCPTCHSKITKGNINYDLVFERKKALGSKG